MLPNEVRKYLLDIEMIISELEKIVEMSLGDYDKFNSNFIYIRAVERDLMIIGEAVNKIIKLNPSINISNTKNIIGLRNLLAHAYDVIDPTVLWRILIIDIPLLKKEITKV